MKRPAKWKIHKCTLRKLHSFSSPYFFVHRKKSTVDYYEISVLDSSTIICFERSKTKKVAKHSLFKMHVWVCNLFGKCTFRLKEQFSLTEMFKHVDYPVNNSTMQKKWCVVCCTLNFKMLNWNSLCTLKFSWYCS